MQKLWLINYIYVEDEGSFDYLKIIINSLKLDINSLPDISCTNTFCHLKLTTQKYFHLMENFWSSQKINIHDFLKQERRNL